MSQTIKRKAKSARKTASAQGKARKIRKARAKTGSAFDRALAWLPLTEEQLHRAFLAVILGACVAMAWLVASLAGVPAVAHRQLVALASDAGFEVHRVDVRGVKHINELKVY
ncbi:MAG: cell division protein FtsQ, partial [Novosphingobium sp.]|nr:cell division protein FtsQ [Novosphingobium sp.]